MLTTGRVFDYEHFNYCIRCGLKYNKDTSRCKDCKYKLRTEPRAGIRKKAFRERIARQKTITQDGKS